MDIEIDDIAIDSIDIDSIVSDVSDDEEVENEEVENEEVHNEEVHNAVVRRVPKRYIRDAQDPFQFYSDAEFRKRFRFNKHSVKLHILPKIEKNLVKVNNLGLPIAPMIQLLICLRFYATGSFQLVLGELMTVSQSTVSSIVFRVSFFLASLLCRHIHMPSTKEEKVVNQRLFEQLGHGDGSIGIPDVVGAVNCTHVRLIETPFQKLDEAYRNSKGYFSLNVQAVIGARTQFQDIVPEYCGKARKNQIFLQSLIRERFAEGEMKEGLLLGGDEYPCLPFLMTPISNPRTDQDLAYNTIHRRTYEITDRTFATWKRRFPCLEKGLATKLLCTTSIVVACAVLHNLSLICDDPWTEADDEVQQAQPVPVPVNRPPLNGVDTRKALIASMFADQ